MIWIGTSGWVYPHWIERFYPPDLPMQDWLAYYASIHTFFRCSKRDTRSMKSMNNLTVSVSLHLKEP